MKSFFIGFHLPLAPVNLSSNYHASNQKLPAIAIVARISLGLEPSLKLDTLQLILAQGLCRDKASRCSNRLRQRSA